MSEGEEEDEQPSNDGLGKALSRAAEGGFCPPGTSSLHRSLRS